MEQIAGFKVLSEAEQQEAYENAKWELDAKEAVWICEQKVFFDEFPEYRDNPDLNNTFVSEVNRLIVTVEGMLMTDRTVLETAKGLIEKETWQ